MRSTNKQLSTPSMLLTNQRTTPRRFAPTSAILTTAVFCLLWQLPTGHASGGVSGAGGNRPHLLLLLLVLPPSPPVQAQGFHPFALFDSLFSDLSAVPLRERERERERKDDVKT